MSGTSSDRIPDLSIGHVSLSLSPIARWAVIEIVFEFFVRISLSFLVRARQEATLEISVR